MALPLFIGLVMIGSVGVVDSYFVAELGEEPLAVLGFVFPIGMVVQALLVGFSVGITGTAALALGANDPRSARRFIVVGLLLMIAIGVVAAGAIGLLQRPLFALMGASTRLPISEYATPFLASTAVMAIPIGVSAALRALGDARSSAYIMLLSAVINAVLDPVLIRGLGPFPELGLAGAGVASLVAAAAAAALALFSLRAHLGRLVLTGREVAHGSRAVIRSISGIGVPALAAQLQGPVAFSAIAVLMAQHGDAAVAAGGVVSRIQMLVLMMPIALRLALEPLVAQSWGAGEFARAARSLHLARRFAAGWGALTWVALAIAAAPIAVLFTDDPAAARVIQEGLWIGPCGYIAVGMTTAATGAFNAIGRARLSAVLSLTYAVCMPTFAAIGSVWIGTAGIFVGAVLADASVTALAWWWARDVGLGAGTVDPRLDAQQAVT